MIGLNRTSIAERHCWTQLQNPGPAIPDSEGGFTTAWTDCDPAHLFLSISPATARELERIAAGTVLATATHIVKGPFHPQVGVQTRLIYRGRVFNVTGGGSPDERRVEMELVVVELLGADLVNDHAWMQPGWLSTNPAWVQAGTF
jgi:head-tail adaptor